MTGVTYHWTACSNKIQERLCKDSALRKEEEESSNNSNNNNNKSFIYTGDIYQNAGLNKMSSK